MILISDDTTETIDATFLESWIVDTGVTVATPALGIDASGAVSGREFIIKGTLQSTAGPAMTLGDPTLADSETSVRIDYLGRLTSGGAGLVALSGGVTFEVTGDVNDAGIVTTSGVALDLRQGGNIIKNDGTIQSTSATAILSAGASDAVENNGAIKGDRHGIVSQGAAMEVENNGSLTASRGYGILSTGTGLMLVNAGTIAASKDAISATGANASITNFATITSSKGAGISVTGTDATIESTTRIVGQTFGILATGDGAHITNAGIVKSSGTGIQATGDGSVIDTTAKLVGNVALAIGGEGSIATNTNEIHGTSKTLAAVRLTGNADFTNDGAVFARSGHAISAAGGANSIENTVSLHGDVRLGGGNDWFSSLVGEVDGKVFGGKGDDVYEAGIKLRIVEKPGEGNDTVKAMFSWTLGANIENLQLIGDAAADARGNTLANILAGNAGDNRFWGLGGRDIFVMQTGGGTDKIMDFQDGTDRIDFRGVDGITGFSDIEGRISQSGRNVVIDLSAEAGEFVLVIRNFDVDDLGARDFLF